MHGREGPGQAGTEGCGRGCNELLAQQLPLGVVRGQLPKSPLQRLPKKPQLLVGLGQLLLGLQEEEQGRLGTQLGWGCPSSADPGPSLRLSPTYGPFSLEAPNPNLLGPTPEK